jgi:phospholipid/cholesterol/gamma-HCH transport system permease protein
VRWLAQETVAVRGVAFSPRVYVTAQRSDKALQLQLGGEWRIAALREIQAQLDAISLDGARVVSIDTRSLVTLDLSTAWVLRSYVERLRVAGIDVQFLAGEPEQLQLIAHTMTVEQATAVKLATAAQAQHELAPVSALGRNVVAAWHSLIAGLDFIGRVSRVMGRALLRPQQWRATAIARHVYDTGITAVPIVALIGFLISVITAYMGAQQLRKFGADIYVVDLVTVGTLREMAVLLTAIIVAGRSGSAFAAEIGAMRLNEETDALKATGVDAVEVLILPRIIGLIIALPLLAVIADAVGLAGGALLCRFLLDMPFVQYFGRMNEAIGPMTFWVGIIKAPVFAILIATAGAYRGLQVRGSSRELGRLTTVAVVQAIFLVILADAMFAVLFMELDI